MSLSKCEHGNFIPSWFKGEGSPYCTGCTPPENETSGDTLERLQDKWEAILEAENIEKL